jgi:Flp pilus assembly protein TadG
LKARVKKRRTESGQAVLLVILAMGTFLLGAVGLAVDGSHLYAQRQMAQAAADAAAQAGIMSIFDDTNTFGSAHFFSTSGTPNVHTCGTGSAGTPCYYAQTLNGFNGTGDRVTYEPNPASVSVPDLSSDPINRLTVTVQRSVPTTLIRMLGPTASTISATGTAAIVNVISPTPIVITHPTLTGALNMNGGNSIIITGGPKTSLQINSKGTYPAAGVAYSGPSSGSVNLSGAGPNGTGANFGTFGGPTTNPGNVLLGSTGRYIGDASPILDPLAGVNPPSPAGLPAGATQSCSAHCGSCPGGAKTCTEYTPGFYTGGININGGAAMFDPGIYYMQGGGFATKNTTVGMCTSCAADPTTKSGMLVYDTGSASGGCDATGGFTIDTNSNDTLLGAGISAANPTAVPSAPYYGILFFEDRNACHHAHTLGQGNGCFSIVGTIYITNSLAVMKATPAQYQEVDYNGTPCAGVNNYGELIVSQLTMKGTASLKMGLFPTGFLAIRQVALVN